MRKEDEVRILRRAPLGKLLVDNIGLPDPHNFGTRHIRRLVRKTVFTAIVTVVFYYLWQAQFFLRGNSLFGCAAIVSLSFAAIHGFQAYNLYVVRRSAYQRWYKYVRLNVLMQRYTLDKLYLNSKSVAELRSVVKLWRDSLHRDSRSTPSVRRLLTGEFDELVRAIE